MSTKKTVPLSLRVSSELKHRLYDVAAKIQKTPHALAQDAVEAAVKAIEQNDFRLVVPVEFRLEPTHVPAKNKPGYQIDRNTTAPYVSNDADQLAREIQDKEIEKIKSGDLADDSHTLGKPEAAPSETPAAPTNSPPPPPSGQTDAAGHTPARKRSRRNRKP